VPKKRLTNEGSMKKGKGSETSLSRNVLRGFRIGGGMGVHTSVTQDLRKDYSRSRQGYFEEKAGNRGGSSELLKGRR